MLEKRRTCNSSNTCIALLSRVWKVKVVGFRYWHIFSSSGQVFFSSLFSPRMLSAGTIAFHASQGPPNACASWCGLKSFWHCVSIGLWSGVSSDVTRVSCSHLFGWAPQDLPYSQVTSWQCGFLGARAGEASHPGPLWKQTLSRTRTSRTPPTVHLMSITIMARSRQLLSLSQALVHRFLLPAPQPRILPSRRCLSVGLARLVAVLLAVVGVRLSP